MNMQQLMAQAQKMQRDLENKKKEVSKMLFVGKSEWYEVTVDGDKNVKSIKALCDDVYDKENADINCDMIMIATNDALKKVDKEMESKMGAYGNLGGLL